MKKCPYCAEMIQEDAIVCRFCNRDLSLHATPRNSVNTGEQAKAEVLPTKKKISKGLLIASGALVGVMFLCCLVFALIPTGKDKNGTQATGTPVAVVGGAQAKTDKASLTPVPKEPSATETPTLTKTNSPTATFTPTPSDTPTPLAPQELTGTSVVQTQEARNTALTATKQAQERLITASAVVAGKTKEAKAATATEVASYVEINWKELNTYPDNHIGEKVIVRGRVFNVISDTDFQIYYAGTYEAAYITMLEPYTGLYEDNTVIVYGMVLGEACGTNAFGGQVCQAQIAGMSFGK